MFTKLFKKSHDPYELGGRWYRIGFINGEIVSNDFGPSVEPSLDTSSNNVTLTLKNEDRSFLFLDYCSALDRNKLNDTVGSGASGYATITYYYNVPGVRFNLGALNLFQRTSGYIYVYAVKNKR